MTKLTRRAAMGATAAAAIGPLAAQAAAPMLGAMMPRVRRMTLGAFEVTTLLAGSQPVENPQTIFGTNVSAGDFATASAAANIPTDKTQFFFTPTVVNTGTELVLFDTGFTGAGIIDVLAEAGYSPDQVDTVVLTHMHGDHIGGLAHEGQLTFPNARYVTNTLEYEAMAASGNAAYGSLIEPLAPRTTFIGDGDSVTGGITAMAAYGHTPGHTGFMLESEGRQLMLIADLANHYVWSLAHPDWEVRFDQDKAAAAAARRQHLGMLAADKIPFIGYHMPFPGVGYVETRGDGFHYVPESYQLML